MGGKWGDTKCHPFSADVMNKNVLRTIRSVIDPLILYELLDDLLLLRLRVNPLNEGIIDGWQGSGDNLKYSLSKQSLAVARRLKKKNPMNSNLLKFNFF